MMEFFEADLLPFGLTHAVQFRGYYGIVPLLASSREKIANICGGRPICFQDKSPDG